MSKHTSGPWEWFYDGGGTYSIGQAPDAQVNPPHVTVWDRDHERAAANCALITSAPEMYEALKHAIAHLETGTVPSDEYLHYFHHAIAKAEGTKTEKTE